MKKEKKIIKSMWNNYGKILSEYMFLKQFRNKKLNKFIEIEGSRFFNQH